MLTVIALALSSIASAQPAPELLQAGSHLEREIAAGETHRYVVELSQGDFLRVTIEQQGANVEADLRDPAGAVVVHRDTQANRLLPERFAFVAEASGPHVLEIRSLAGEPSGRYSVLVPTLRPATGFDRAEAAADTAHEAGWASTDEQRRDALAAARAKLTALVAEARRQTRGPSAEPITLYHLGRLELAAGNPDGIRILEDLRARMRGPQENEYLEMLVLQALGDAHDAQGEKAAALEEYREALSLSEREKDDEGVSLFASKVGLVLSSLGQAEQALEAFTRARALYRAAGDTQNEAIAVNNIAAAFRMLGDYQKAIDAAEEALSIHRAAGIRQGESALVSNIGHLHRLLGETAQARDRFREARALADKTQSVQEQAMSDSGLAAVDLADGDFEKALLHANSGLAGWTAAGNANECAAALDLVGRAWHGLSGGRDARQLDYAMASLREALMIRRRFHHRRGEVDVLVDMALVERDRGRLPEALEQARAAVELTEAMRAEVTNPDLRASFMAAQHDVYGVYSELLMLSHEREPSAGHDAEALQASERAHARVLLEALVEARADIRLGVDLALLERERTAQARLALASDRLSAALLAKAADAERSRAGFEDAAADLRAVQSRIRTTSPRYAALTQPVPASVEEVRHDLLDEDTVLIEYQLGDRRSFAFALTRSALATAALPRRSEIETAARQLHSLLTVRQRTMEAGAVAEADSALARQAAALRRMLLAVFEAQLRGPWAGKRLVIVPAGALAYVPFGVLPAPHDPARPLLLDHEVVYAPSASVLLAMRREQRPKKAAATVAVLADPVFEATDPRVHGRPGPPVALPPGLRRAAEGLGRAGFARLPFSRREADAILALASAPSALEALDFDASRTLVASGAVADRRILHFATHGILDGEHPDLSGLVLSLVDARGAPVDGFLRMPDVYNLRLSADLVVLSACQTALGREMRGEGLLGLTRGFIYAGARAVVASLWQVDDESTAELMKRFYRGMLKERRRPADALRQAQIEMSRTKRWSAPFYWAGFVLQGDWR